MYRLYRLVFVLIRVLRLWLPGRDHACSGPCYRPLKHGFFMEEFSLGGLLGLLVAVVAVVPGRDAAVERVWAGKPCLLHESIDYPLNYPIKTGRVVKLMSRPRPLRHLL